VQAFGCDYSSDALLQAKRNEIEVVQGGFDEIGQFGSADILILSHVFEHFPDLNLALEQINTLIHDSSLIYIEVPGVDDLVNKAEYGFNYQVYCVLAHTYNFSLRSLTAVMSSGGFRLLEGDEYVRSIFVKGEAQKELNSAYETTIYALEKAYKKSDVLYTKRNNPVYLYLKNVAKAILGRNPS
jgi:SAM-dependent methyltransferase